MPIKKRRSLKKQLFLDRPTSHGGWPNGQNNSWQGKKTVNNIIYDYLEAMGLTADVPHARLSEVYIKRLVMEAIKRNLT